MDAERWLVAHRVTEMVVLCAQHLGDRMTEALEEHVRGQLGIALTLIYGGRARIRRAATTTLGTYLAKERHPLAGHRRSRLWPRVPRSHPMRLRYDCW